MEQRQFRVSLSVGSKLLISVVTLLFIVILFLDISTILVLTEDKRAYTYQSQSTEAVLFGREFVNDVSNAVDTLRLSLASIDPMKPVTPTQLHSLQSMVNNQAAVLGVSLKLVNSSSLDSRVLAEAWHQEELKKSELSPAELMVSKDWLKVGLPQLTSRGFAYFNLSKVGHSPVVAVALADKKFAESAAGLPVAIGFISLRGFAKDAKSSSLTIASREGWILYDSDPKELFAQKNIIEDPLFESQLQNQLASGTQEYAKDGVRYLGSYVRPGFDLVVLSKTEWRKAMRATYALTEKFILLGLMAIGSAIIFAIFFSKTLTAPINRLYEATKEVSKGNFNVQLKATGGDEIGALTSSFGLMSEKIVALIEESMAKVRLEGEIAIASTVQQTLFPPPVFKNDNVHIFSHYQSASECGGDWWGFFGVKDKLCLMIADATGHGIPSALITASARSCFSVMHKLAQEDPDFTFSPGSMLAYANRVVYDAASGKIMMTFFTAVIDFGTGKLTYASAGHNPPWLFKKEGTGFTLKSLVAQGQRLGEARDVPPYEEKSIDVAPGDIFFMYTDGVTEGKNKADEMYGKKKVRKMVEGALSKGPEKVITSLVADFMGHNEGKPLDDDVTLAAAQILSVGSTGKS